MRYATGFCVLSLFLTLAVSAVQAIDLVPAERYLWTYTSLLLPGGGEHSLFFMDSTTEGEVLAWSATDNAVFVVTSTAILPLACDQDPFVLTGDAINRQGSVIGSCLVDGRQQAALWRQGRQGYGLHSTFEVPGASQTQPYGLNDYEQSVGVYYTPTTGGPFAFFAVGGRTMAFGSENSVPYAITNWGGIVGYTIRFDGREGRPRNHGWFYYRGQEQLIDPPGSDFTLIADMNESGVLVGVYSEGLDAHSFLSPTPGVFQEVVSPDPFVFFTDVTGINNQGQLVGNVLLHDPADPDHSNLLRGFVATPLPADVNAPAVSRANAPQAVVARTQSLTAAPPRPRVTLNTTSCEEGRDASGNYRVVPLKLRSILGCP